MNENTQILTFELFKRFCNDYKEYLAFNNKDDNLDNFSVFMQTAFDTYNTSWAEKDYNKLYSLFLYSKDNVDVDFKNLPEVSGKYYQFLQLVNNANFNLEDNLEAFTTFVAETTSAKIINSNSAKAIYDTLTLATQNRLLMPEEQENILKTLNLKLRKMHPVRDFLLKKGGTLATIAAGAFIGSAVAAATLPAILGGLVATSAVNNVFTFGSIGLVAGAALSYAGIKIKNACTKAHYKKKIFVKKGKKDELKELENGLINVEQLEINSLIEKTRNVNAEILKLKEPTKNPFVKVWRKVKRHALNIANRNRVHAISDALEIANDRINTIMSDENLSYNERVAKMENLQKFRSHIANIRAGELIEGIAQTLSSEKDYKIENLDIYAKDILETKNQRSDPKVVKAKANEILTNLLSGDISMLAGKYVFGGKVDLEKNSQFQVAGYLTEPKEEPKKEPVEEQPKEEPVKEEPVKEEAKPDETADSKPQKPIIPTLIGAREKDIAAETTMLTLLQNKNVIKDLLDENFSPELLAAFTTDLINRQKVTFANGKPKAKTRMRTTKFFKETEGVAELYSYLINYNITHERPQSVDDTTTSLNDATI